MSVVEPIVVVPYDPEWPDLFAALGRRLRTALGAVALRIDHIGSTAVPGLDAKPVIDVQVSVTDFEPLAAFAAPLQSLGFVHRMDNPDRAKRYFREAPDQPRTHIHLRRAGSFSEQFALLFRDYMRANDEEAKEYARLKYALAEEHQGQRQAYVEAKTPFIWAVMKRADRWSKKVGWVPGASDA